MMEFDVSSVIELLGLLLGGGGIGVFITWRYLRRQEAAKTKQEEAAAATAEVGTTKEVQDVYQQMISDVKADREEQKEYIKELKEDRFHLREERNELRRRLDDTEEKMRFQGKEIARLGNRLDSLTPFICTLTGCQKRVRNYIGLVSDESFEPHNSHVDEESENCDEECPSEDSEDGVTNKKRKGKKK